MAIVGGLRARLTRDSLFYMLQDKLGLLGWFTAQVSRTPITFVAEPPSLDTEVPLNSLALADDSSQGIDIELGSGLAEQTWAYFVDFYAENDALGLHLIRDVKDLLEGRMASIGRSNNTLTVLDWSLATPAPIFVCQIEQVATHRAHDFPHPWLRHWHSCSFTLVDTYDNESQDEVSPALAAGMLITEQGESLLTELGENLDWES